MPMIKSDHKHGKYCPKCKDVRPLDDFNLNKRNADGHAAYCKEHERKIAMDGYRQHAEQRRKSRRNRYAKQKQIGLFSSTRPECGPRCGCGVVLYAYEIRLGKCLPCQVKRIRSGAYALAQMGAGG